MTDVGPIDMSSLYYRAAEVVERALVLNPSYGFALADLIDDERDLVASLENPVAAHMLITGTVEGIVRALAHTPDPLTVIRELDPMDPPGGEVTADDMETAYARIETALLNQQQQADHRPLPGDTVSFDPFAEDPVHASSQILALVAAGNDIATARRG